MPTISLHIDAWFNIDRVLKDWKRSKTCQPTHTHADRFVLMVILCISPGQSPTITARDFKSDTEFAAALQPRTYSHGREKKNLHPNEREGCLWLTESCRHHQALTSQRLSDLVVVVVVAAVQYLPHRSGPQVNNPLLPLPGWRIHDIKREECGRRKKASSPTLRLLVIRSSSCDLALNFLTNTHTHAYTQQMINDK